MPSYWYKSYEQILIGLCRLDKVTQYLRIPPELWSLGWSPMVMDLENLAFASIPIDYLHDKDILEVYVKRLLTLGKTTISLKRSNFFLKTELTILKYVCQ